MFQGDQFSSDKTRTGVLLGYFLRLLDCTNATEDEVSLSLSLSLSRLVVELRRAKHNVEWIEKAVGEIQKQAEIVTEVKRSHSAVIDNPLCLPLRATIGEARTFCKKHNINGILIETEPGSNILTGVLTRRDMPWQSTSDNLSVENFMTPLEKLKTAF